MAPLQFVDIGKTATDLLTKDYNFDHKFILQLPSYNGMGITATGLKKDQIFLGDIQSLYRTGNVAVDVKLDTLSNVSTKITFDEALPCIKTALSFKIPDHKSGKLDLYYVHPHVTANSSIGLNPAPVLEVNATIGTKDLSVGGEVGFDTASGSFTKYNTGISFNKPDFSAALVLMDKGQALRASYIHNLDDSNRTAVAAEMTHRFSGYENSFTIGSSHSVDHLTLVKTRLSNKGQLGMLCQHEWRPKSLVTFSCAFDTKAAKSSGPKLGLAVALKP